MICIIILNWNGTELSLGCLKSLTALNYSDFHVILVDNGSKQVSIKPIKEFTKDYSNIEILELDDNYGFAEGNNIGIKYAIDKYSPEGVILLNNDTVVDFNFINGFLEAQKAYPDAYAFVSKVYYFDTPHLLNFAGGKVGYFSGVAKHFGDNREDEAQFNKVVETQFMFGCSCLITKECLDNVGLLDSTFFANSEDSDYSLRILKKKKKIIFAPTSIVYHKSHATFKANKGKWFTFYLATRNIIILQLKHLPTIIFPAFFIYFLVRWCTYLTLKLLFIRDFKSIKGIIIGLYHGLRYLFGLNSSFPSKL